MHEKANALRFLFLAVFCLFAVYLVFFSKWSSDFSYSSFKNIVESSGIYGVFAFFLITILCAIFLIPTSVPNAIGALMYGPWLGTLLNVLAMTLGSAFTYFISKSLGRRFVENMLEGRFESFKNNIEQKGFQIVFFVRLVMVFPFFIMNYVFGLTRVRFWDYFFGTLLGTIPSTFVWTYLVASLGERVLTDGVQLADFMNLHVLIPALAIMLFAVLAAAYQKKFKQILSGL